MQRLSSTPTGETLSIGVRLPPPLLELVDREVERLRVGAAEPDKIVRGTAIRALLVELEQRRAADPTSTPAPRLSRASLARIVAAVEGAGAELRGLLEDDGEEEVGGEGETQRRRQERRPQGQVRQPRGGARTEGRPAVLHTAAGQLSLLTPTANDGAQHPPKAPESSRSHRARRPASESGAPASAEVLAALKPRLVAANGAGRSLTVIGREAGVDPACLSRWLKGTRAGVSVASAHKLGAYLASIGF